MNAELLKPEVQNWIRKNQSIALHELAFKKSPFTNITIQELLTQINGINKLSQKVDWLSQEKNIYYPPSLNLEQSSSWQTAEYKANLFKTDSLKSNEPIVDLTGGFGVDCIAFSKAEHEVIHIEPDLDLQTIAQHNFKVLNLNIKSYPLNAEDFLSQNQDYKNFYLDPSRRDENKNKVFLLEELSPNPLCIVYILEKIKAFKKIIIKLSPLFDLNALIKDFKNLHTIHIVAVKNEVKEILVEINSVKSENIIVKAVNLNSPDQEYSFEWNDNSNSKTFSELKTFIYEPNAAIQKAQNFLSLEKKFKILKLSANTNLWTSDKYQEDFPGRVYKFLKPLKNLKKELKNQSIQIIHRNFPEKLTTLQKRYKFKTDGTNPIFFTSDIKNKHIFKAERLR